MNRRNIAEVHGREILDSRGNPTVEADNRPWAAVQRGYRVRGRPYGENGDWVCFLRRYSRRFAARLVLPP